MIRFTWIQARIQLAVALGALAMMAIVLAITGPHLVHLYDTIVGTCKTSGDCPIAGTEFLKNDRGIQLGLDGLLTVVPGIIGIFWGAPLGARELEAGTFRLVWTQGITRTRWLAVKLSVMGLASVAVAGLVSLMVTWWSSPVDRVNMSPFTSFDTRGVVPIGYAVFAFTLGEATGTLMRRILPAMASTLVAFTGVRLAIAQLVRPYFIRPLHLAVADNVIAANGPTPAPAGLNPRDWILSNQTINASGHVIGHDGTVGFGSNIGLNIGVGPHGVSIGGVGSCPNIVPVRAPGAVPSAANAHNLVQQCVNQLHIRELLTYQPSSRYWVFQWYELAIFLGLALAMVGLSFWWIRRRLV